MPWGTKDMPPKKIGAGVPLAIGVRLTWTFSKTICQPPPYGGGVDIKTMPNAFVTANKIRRYGPIIAHSHVNLKPRHNTDTGS